MWPIDGKILIISADCTCALETCFCLALGLMPHPEEGFDINLSPVENGFLLESASEKGQSLIEKNLSLFTQARNEHFSQRESVRTKTAAQVTENLKVNEVPHQDRFEGIIKRNFESEIWKEEAKTCVECGACTIICPTCHCFLLYDQKNETAMARLRVWDSCMIKDYARVAGGGNPRPKLWMRLRNRFEKKFDFFPKVAKVYACTGCGRCITGLPGENRYPSCPSQVGEQPCVKILTGLSKQRYWTSLPKRPASRPSVLGPTNR